MTMSVGDLLDEWVESDSIKGAFASTGVVGVWAGPAARARRTTCSTTRSGSSRG